MTFLVLETWYTGSHRPVIYYFLLSCLFLVLSFCLIARTVFLVNRAKVETLKEIRKSKLSHRFLFNALHSRSYVAQDLLNREESNCIGYFLNHIKTQLTRHSLSYPPPFFWCHFNRNLALIDGLQSGTLQKVGRKEPQ